MVSFQINIISLALSMHFAAAAVIPCSDGKLVDNVCIFPVNRHNAWDIGADECFSRQGAELFVPKSQDEFDAAVEILKSSGHKSMWVNAMSEVGWFWSDKSDVSVTDWGVGEPSNDKGQQTAIQMMMKLGYKWNDANMGEIASDIPTGGTMNKFVCEYPGTCNGSYHYPDPRHDWNGESCFVFQSKTTHTDYDGRCVSFNEVNVNHPDPNYWKKYCYTRGISWNDANKLCRDAKGRLAKVDTPEKISALLDFIKDKANKDKRFSGNYWIGGSRQLRWVWGSDSSFTDKLPSPTSSDMCGSLSVGGVVEARACEDMQLALCSYSTAADSDQSTPGQFKSTTTQDLNIIGR